MNSKKELRLSLKAARKETFDKYMEDPQLYYRLIQENTISAIQSLIPGNCIVAGYYTMSTEIDCNYILKELAKTHTVALPSIQGDHLVFREWDTKESSLVKGKFGIPEPQGNQVTPQVVLAPLLGFDDNCFRLGYGGGFYDKAFEHLEALKIGVAFSTQQVKQLPVEEFDMPLDFVVTELGVTSIRNNH